MAFAKQFLTKTKASDNTSVFRYSPMLSEGEVEVYALISISNDVEAETSRFNKFVWDGFLDGFLSKEEDVITRLKNAMVASEFKLKELIKNDDLLEEKGVNLNLSVLIFKSGKVFVGVSGEHKVYVYKNKWIDISDLLAKNKSNVGSTLVSQEDIFLVWHNKKKIQEDLLKLHNYSVMETFLSDIFEKEDASGGAFLATLEDKVVPKSEEIKSIPDPVEKTVKVEEIEEKSVDEQIENNTADNDEEPVDQEKIEEQALDKKEKVKKGFLFFFNRLKLVFNKIVDFLTQKLSAFKEKVSLSLYSKYGRKRWFKKLQSITSVKKFTRGVKPFKVDDYKEKDLRTRRFVAFFVILILVLTVFFGFKSAFDSRQANLLGAELSTLVEDWETSLDTAERDIDDEESLVALKKVQKELDDYLDKLEEEGLFSRLGENNTQKLEDFQDRLSSVRDEVYRIVPVGGDHENFELFLDTKLKFGERSNPVDMVISRESKIAIGEILYILDAGEKKVYEVFLRDGNYRSIADPDGLIKEPMFLDLGNNRDDEAIYVYDAQSGALRAGTDEEGKLNNFKTLSGLNPRAIGEDGVVAFAVFGPRDSLNFLIPSQSRIIRSEGFGGTTYNLPSEYISHPSFEEGTDLFGDQYVYVLSTITNGIRRFVPATSLNSQLSVTGLREDLQSITAGYTGTTMDRVLILFDSDSKRFVQFTKPIEMGQNLVHPGEIVLRRQYEYRGSRDDVFKDVRSLVLTHNDRKMYVLDERKIWEINLDL